MNPSCFNPEERAPMPELNQKEAIRKTIQHFGGPNTPGAKDNISIQTYVKDHYGHDVTTQYIAVIKSEMRKEKETDVVETAPVRETRKTGTTGRDNGDQDNGDHL